MDDRINSIQILAREANWERRREVEDAQDDWELELECACGRVFCSERMLLTVAEFEAVHEWPGRFLVAPGHAIPGFDTIVQHHRHFDVVENRHNYATEPPAAA